MQSRRWLLHWSFGPCLILYHNDCCCNSNRRCISQRFENSTNALPIRNGLWQAGIQRGWEIIKKMFGQVKWKYQLKIFPQRSSRFSTLQFWSMHRFYWFVGLWRWLVVFNNLDRSIRLIQMIILIFSQAFERYYWAGDSDEMLPNDIPGDAFDFLDLLDASAHFDWIMQAYLHLLFETNV